jgi:transposase
MLASVVEKITKLIKESETLSPVARVLQDCQGVGLVTRAVLVARMPERGRISRRQAAALAGLAPYANDSGKHEGKRITRGGRPRLKRALYLASLSALRHHPGLKTTYQTLRQRGKPAKVTITAVARKLLVILNARLKEHYATTAMPA